MIKIKSGFHTILININNKEYYINTNINNIYKYDIIINNINTLISQLTFNVHDRFYCNYLRYYYDFIEKYKLILVMPAKYSRSYSCVDVDVYNCNKILSQAPIITINNYFKYMYSQSFYNFQMYKIYKLYEYVNDLSIIYNIPPINKIKKLVLLTNNKIINYTICIK